MSSAKLSKLESLSKTRADQARDVVQSQRSELSRLDRQHKDLKTINFDYQNGIVAQPGVTPQLLAHRREFVTQLTEKLNMLHLQRQQKDQVLRQKQTEYQHRIAQTAAISTLVERSEREEAYVAARREQLQLEESVQGLQQAKRVNKEDDDA